MEKKLDQLDPDFFDVMVQSLSVLSSVATMATTWIAIRQDRDLQRPDQPTDMIRQQLRELRRAMEDCFESVENALRLLQEADTRAGGNLLQTRPKFGVGVMLNHNEFHLVIQQLNNLDHACLRSRSAARNLHTTLQHSNLDSTMNVAFNIQDFNADLNAILFESLTFADAIAKLRIASQKADDFVNELERALRRN